MYVPERWQGRRFRHLGLSTPHYTDVIMSMMASQITSLTIVYSTVYSGADQRNIKAQRYWPLCGEFTGDRWIPRTKGQLRGKYLDDVIMIFDTPTLRHHHLLLGYSMGFNWIPRINGYFFNKQYILQLSLSIPDTLMVWAFWTQSFILFHLLSERSNYVIGPGDWARSSMSGRGAYLTAWEWVFPRYSSNSCQGTYREPSFALLKQWFDTRMFKKRPLSCLCHIATFINALLWFGLYILPVIFNVKRRACFFFQDRELFSKLSSDFSAPLSALFSLLGAISSSFPERSRHTSYTMGLMEPMLCSLLPFRTQLWTVEWEASV